jgi:hypothetical protein
VKARHNIVFLLCLVFPAFAFPVFGENEFTFRLEPQFVGPVDVINFEGGFGAAAALDWGLLPFGSAMKLGLGLGGGFSSLSIADGSAFSLFEGAAGPFLTWRVLDRLTLRAEAMAGVYRYQWGERNNTRLRFGGGLQAFYHLSPSVSLYANGGYTHYAFSADRPINTIRAGIGVSLNISEILNPQTRIQGEITEQQRVFPVSYAWYEDNEIAKVRITNNEPNTITAVGLSFFLEQYMNNAVVFASIPRLLPGEQVEVPVTALFNESMLDLTESSNANALVLAEYRSLGARKQTSFPVQIPVYHRNAMSWDDDRRAASFVSARDPAAVYFARYVESALRGFLRPEIPQNVQYALALFEALNSYGINYVIDPASSYVEMAENASALDSLNYPYQTLMYRGGDCDDLSILFCSLLEVLGIDTAFITVPGHIYVAFDVGVGGEELGVRSEEGGVRREELGSWNLRRADLIEYEGKFWVPVEITVPGEGFNRAWRIGAREWGVAGEDAALYPMRDNWGLYQPVSVPGAGDRLPAMPEETEILRRFGIEMGRLAP